MLYFGSVDLQREVNPTVNQSYVGGVGIFLSTPILNFSHKSRARSPRPFAVAMQATNLSKQPFVPDLHKLIVTQPWKIGKLLATVDS